MTESKKTLESEGTTARPKEKPYVPIENRPLLGVDEVEALTGVPAKIIRAQVRNGLLKARMAGSTTMRIRTTTTMRMSRARTDTSMRTRRR